jgi:hypothetical protein
MPVRGELQLRSGRIVHVMALRQWPTYEGWLVGACPPPETTAASSTTAANLADARGEVLDLEAIGQ